MGDHLNNHSSAAADGARVFISTDDVMHEALIDEGGSDYALQVAATYVSTSILRCRTVQHVSSETMQCASML
eukprot:15837-Eustigmatos_ZCMA.PRE.1